MAAILEYIVKEKEEGSTVEQLLKKHFGISTGLLRELKYNDKIFINGKACRSIDKVYIKDIISADVSESRPDFGHITPFESEIEVLYEDEFVLAVNKPGNMESHPCPSNRETTLANAVMYYWGQKGEYHNYHIVNRLDKGTSGICLIAKNRFAHGVLSGQMKSGNIKKEYSAVVHGKLEPLSGEINLPIGRSETSIIKRVVRSDGKASKTIYKTAYTRRSYSLVDISLETGRTHQIRVHFSHIGYPLVGDWLYGMGDDEKHIISRQALHAKRLEFIHPATKENIVLSTDIPEEMKKLLNLD